MGWYDGSSAQSSITGLCGRTKLTTKMAVAEAERIMRIRRSRRRKGEMSVRRKTTALLIYTPWYSWTTLTDRQYRCQHHRRVERQGGGSGTDTDVRRQLRPPLDSLSSNDGSKISSGCRRRITTKTIEAEAMAVAPAGSRRRRKARRMTIWSL